MTDRNISAAAFDATLLGGTYVQARTHLYMLGLASMLGNEDASASDVTTSLAGVVAKAGKALGMLHPERDAYRKNPGKDGKPKPADMNRLRGEIGFLVKMGALAITEHGAALGQRVRGCNQPEDAAALAAHLERFAYTEKAGKTIRAPWACPDAMDKRREANAKAKQRAKRAEDDNLGITPQGRALYRAVNTALENIAGMDGMPDDGMRAALALAEALAEALAKVGVVDMDVGEIPISSEAVNEALAQAG